MLGFNEVDVVTLAQWAESGRGVRLIDVRTPAETARGVIGGAELLPLHLLPLKSNEIAGDEKVIFYCQSGARSAQACMFMAQQGNSEVYNLQGGIMAWVASGQPVIEPAPDAILAS